MGLHEDLLRAIMDLEFTRPTPVQVEAIPAGLAGRDVLGCAMTGSGKTAAFLLPILQRLRGRPRGVTRALVLTPTRELAAQTVAHFDELAKYTELRAAAVYGGVAIGPQAAAFRRGVDLIAA
ncbi:MAG: DEAD/DEAH box helicase, partial [Planctomycetaceae bacterium]